MNYSVDHSGGRFTFTIHDAEGDQVYELTRHEIVILDRTIMSALNEDSLEEGMLADNRESFARLRNTDDRCLQYLVSKITTADLALALLHSEDEEVRKSVFKNLSERAGEIMREEMDSIGEAGTREGREAIDRIMRTASELDAESESYFQFRFADPYEKYI